MRHFLFSSLLTLFLLTSYSIGEPKSHGKGAKTKGTVRESIVKGEVREALSGAEARALEAEKNNDWEKAAEYYRQASRAARITGQLQKAISYGNKAFEMGEKAGSPQYQVRAIGRLVPAYRRVGQHAKARELLQKGIEILKQIPPGGFKEDHESNFYIELGMDFLRSGEAQKAIEYISYALQVREAQLTFLRGRKRVNPQVVQNSLNQIPAVLEKLGTAYRRAGNEGEAIKAYERGISLIKEGGLKIPVESSLYQGLGRLYLDQKDYSRAEENLKKALEMAEKTQHARVIERASSQIGNVFLQTQRPSEAIPYYKKAIDTIESTRSLLESEELRTTFFEDKGQIYGGMILAHLEAKSVEEAFNYAERARSRAFLDILGSKVQLARGGALLEEERALQARISTIKAKLADQGGGEDENEESERRQLRRELEAAQNAYTDFLTKVRKEDKEQASLMTVEPLTLKQLQEMLEPGVTVLEYFVLRGRAVLWVVEKDRVDIVRLTLNRRELISKVGALRDSIYQVGEKEKFKQTSQELYKVLIEPALPHIRGKELLIIPHDVLHYLPFQAMLSPQGKYLIQDYPIYYLSSASLMQFTREKRRASSGSGERALVMGNPSLGDPAYNLRFAEREAKEVARLYPRSAVYLRKEATKPRAVSLSPNYDILHFAVHGELREDEPLASGLLLGGEGKQDGRLTVADIFTLNLKADAVVLSACETGLGKITSGDEVIGLTRAFIYAGTPSIITTLWKVNDRASYELVGEFYSNLRTKKKAEALRQAQLKIMEAYPEPFFWAAYGLTGEP